MEIHKPKPVHNLRELLTEIAVIAVGIVIALTAEQMLQALDGRERVKRAEEQMRLEMAKDDGPVVIQRRALPPFPPPNRDGMPRSPNRCSR